MEQDTAEERLAVGCALDGRAADQNRSAGVEADLLVRTVGLEGAHVLHEDELTPAGEHGGNHDRNHANLIHVDACSIGDGAVLADRAELLAKAGTHDDDVEHAQRGDQHKGDHRHLHHGEQRLHRRNLIDQAKRSHQGDENAALLPVHLFGRQHQQHDHRDNRAGDVQRRTKLDLPQAVKRILEAAAGGQVDGVGDAGGAHDHQARRVQRNQVAEDEQEQQLIKTVGKVTQDHTADHFLALHLVVQAADQETEERSDRQRHQRCKRKAADAADAPFNNPQRRDLRSHGADGDGKVDAHAGDDRDDQREDDEHVAGQTAKKLIHHVRGRLAGDRHAAHAQQDKHDRNRIVAKNLAHVFLSHEIHLQTWSARRE